MPPLVLNLVCKASQDNGEKLQQPCQLVVTPWPYTHAGFYERSTAAVSKTCGGLRWTKAGSPDSKLPPYFPLNGGRLVRPPSFASPAGAGRLLVDRCRDESKIRLTRPRQSHQADSVILGGRRFQATVTAAPV